MGKKREYIPGLRPPTDREHESVDRWLITQFRKEVRPPGKGPIIGGVIVACLLLIGLLRGNMDVPGAVAFLALEGLMVYLYHGNVKLAQSREKLVREMEQRNYLVVPAIAEEIRLGWNQSTVDRHGETNIRLENGTLLHEKYIVAYEFAREAEQSGANKNVPVLVVYVPCRNYYRVVPQNSGGSTCRSSSETSILSPKG